MYAIGLLIYGVPMNDRLMARMRKLGENDFFEKERGAPAPQEAEANIREWEGDAPFGFERVYTGDGYAPGYLGAKLFEFDECDYGIALAKLADKAKVSRRRKASVAKMLAKLRPDLRALCPKPAVWIVWDHS